MANCVFLLVHNGRIWPIYVCIWPRSKKAHLPLTVPYHMVLTVQWRDAQKSQTCSEYTCEDIPERDTRKNMCREYCTYCVLREYGLSTARQSNVPCTSAPFVSAMERLTARDTITAVPPRCTSIFPQTPTGPHTLEKGCVLRGFQDVRCSE